MTKRTIFRASFLILVLALGATSAQAQIKAIPQAGGGDGASPVKTGAPFRLDWRLFSAAATRVGARPLGFRLLPPSSGYGHAGAKALSLRAAPLGVEPSVKGRERHARTAPEMAGQPDDR